MASFRHDQPAVCPGLCPNSSARSEHESPGYRHRSALYFHQSQSPSFRRKPGLLHPPHRGYRIKSQSNRNEHPHPPCLFSAIYKKTGEPLPFAVRQSCFTPSFASPSSFDGGFSFLSLSIPHPTTPWRGERKKTFSTRQPLWGEQK